MTLTLRGLGHMFKEQLSIFVLCKDYFLRSPPFVAYFLEFLPTIAIVIHERALPSLNLPVLFILHPSDSKQEHIQHHTSHTDRIRVAASSGAYEVYYLHKATSARECAGTMIVHR